MGARKKARTSTANHDHIIHPHSRPGRRRTGQPVAKTMICNKYEKKMSKMNPTRSIS